MGLLCLGMGKVGTQKNLKPKYDYRRSAKTLRATHKHQKNITTIAIYLCFCASALIDVLTLALLFFRLQPEEKERPNIGNAPKLQDINNHCYLIGRPMRPQRGMNVSLFQDQYLIKATPLIAERSTKRQKRLSYERSRLSPMTK